MGSSKWAYGSFFVNTANDAPGPFAVSSPADDVEIDTVTPNLAVTNSTDVDEDVLTYAFMVASDSGLTDIVASVSGIPAGGNGNTSWVVSPSLVDNTWYYWKAIATDAHGASTATAVASFIVNTINSAPQPPAIFGPANEAEVPSTDIELVVYNAADADGDPLHYLFQIDTANTFDGTSKAGSEPIAEEGDGTTGWQFTGLQDETRYYWRVKTGDGFAESAWVVGNFFVNLANDSPSIPRLKNPADNAWVITTAPKLEVGESVDSDHDSIRYQFEVYDDDLNQLVASGESETPQWVVSQALQDSRWYRWKARAVDEHDAAGIWMTEARFYTDSSGINEVPVISVVSPVADVLTNGNFIQITWQDSDQDSSAWISLFYDTDAGGVAPILVVTGLQEDPDGDDDSYVWDISTMAGGRYYISAVISDGDGYDTSHAAGTVSIDRTAPVISASVPGGTYTVEQTVALTVNEEATIHFTLDGSEPGANSAIYTLPIEIAETATLKCAAVDSAGNWSSTLTEIYTIESENAAICDYTDPAARAPASGSGTQADPYVVTDCCALQGIADANGQYYVLGNDIDCSDTVTWNAGAGFIPLGGNGGLIYSGGGLDGQGHTISDVFINDALYTGLFARASNVAIKRLGLENANIIGTTLVGAVISNAYGGTSVNEVFATGSVSGSAATVGGLVGSAGTGFAIKDSYFSGQVSGSAVLGGLIGVATNTNGVENCYADATVTGTSHSVGGLIGNFGGTISPASISNSYATGTVDTGSYTFRVGGLVGYLAAGGSVINSYWFNNKAICIGQDLGVSSDCSEAIPDESQFFNNCNQPVLEWDFATAWGLDDSAADSSPCLRWQNCSFAEVCP